MPQIPPHCCLSEISVLLNSHIYLCTDCFSLLLRLHLSISAANTSYYMLYWVLSVVYKIYICFKYTYMWGMHASWYLVRIFYHRFVSLVYYFSGPTWNWCSTWQKSIVNKCCVRLFAQLFRYNRLHLYPEQYAQCMWANASYVHLELPIFAAVLEEFPRVG